MEENRKLNFKGSLTTGRAAKKLCLTAEEMGCVHLDCTFVSGSVIKIITQSDKSHREDMPTAFVGMVDLSDFEPGDVEFLFECSNVNGLNLRLEVLDQ